MESKNSGMAGASALLLLLLLLGLLSHPSHAYTLSDYSGFGAGLDPDDSMYVSSEKYLLYLRQYSHNTMIGLRTLMGVGEIKAGITRWQCTGTLSCILGGPGQSWSPDAGYTSIIEMAGLFLNSATISTLSAIFMGFTLRYITGGLLLYFLPFGIALRSLSFTRPLGSILIALVLSLYIFYPFMLMLNSIIFPPIAGPPPDLGPYTAEQDLGGNIVGPAGNAPAMDSLIRWTAYSFFGAIFLPAINMIVIVALARETGRLLGEELDISRLSQMV